MTLITRETKVLIQDDVPFEHDAFQTNLQYSELVRLIEQTETPFVYAINAPWGSGKTTFIEMAAAELKKNGYTAFIINVWMNDHLLGTKEVFLNHLTEILLNLDKNTMVKRNAKRFLVANKKIIIELFRLALKLYVRNADADIKDILEDIGIKLKDVKDSAMDVIQGSKDLPPTLTSRTTTIQKINEHLQILIDKHLKNKDEKDKGKAVIIFIDELDRCIPERVINFLDNLKHIFELRNVIFVLSVDKEQLAHSVQAIYGTKFSVYSYLDRFINLYFNLDSTRFFSEYFESKMLDKMRLEALRGKLDARLHREVNSFIQNIRSYIVGFRLTVRDLNWVSNFTVEYLIVNPLQWVGHLDYIVFVSLLKRKYPMEYSGFFQEYLEQRELDKKITKMVDKLTYFNTSYFEYTLLPRFLLHVIGPLKLIKEFADYQMEGRFDYSKVIEKVSEYDYGDESIEAPTLLKAIEKYVKN